MAPDPDLYGPPEYEPDDPAADDELWDQAARDQAEQDSMAVNEGLTAIGWDNLGHDRDEDLEGWPDAY